MDTFTPNFLDGKEPFTYNQEEGAYRYFMESVGFEKATGLCDMVIGFYGSRIRDHLSIMPQCPTLLFFPEKEQPSDVDTLIANPRNHSQTVAEKMAGELGFAEPFSRHYNRRSSLLSTRKILSSLLNQNLK